MLPCIEESLLRAGTYFLAFFVASVCPICATPRPFNNLKGSEILQDARKIGAIMVCVDCSQNIQRQSQDSAALFRRDAGLCAPTNAIGKGFQLQTQRFPRRDCELAQA